MSTKSLVLTASILSIEPREMETAIASVASGIDAVQLDIMDGTFVRNKTYGAEVIDYLATDLPLDVHLMVQNPAEWVDGFLEKGAGHVTFHAEAVTDTADRRALIETIRKGGATAGIAINPGTPVTAIGDIVNEVDMVLVMSVEPGLGGQPFIGSVLEKIKALHEAHPGLMVQVDGGINQETAALSIAAGARNLVVGSALFNASDRLAFLHALRHGIA